MFNITWTLRNTSRIPRNFSNFLWWLSSTVEPKQRVLVYSISDNLAALSFIQIQIQRSLKYVFIQYTNYKQCCAYYFLNNLQQNFVCRISNYFNIKRKFEICMSFWRVRRNCIIHRCNCHDLHYTWHFTVNFENIAIC